MSVPESPNYIDVPSSLQPDLPPKPKVKGVLPVPREIFPKRRPDKATQAFADEATPEPTRSKISPNAPHKEYLEWKEKMAEVRRQHLREGLKELYSRKQKAESKVAHNSKVKLKYREKILHQPPREDERLTRASSVDLKIVPGKRGASKKLTMRIAARKKQQRLAALNTLYMNARHFIVNEEQLAKEIDRVFTEGPNPEWATDRSDGHNIWNRGPPFTVERMVARMHDEKTTHEIVQERTKKLAETLTGGEI